MFIECLLHPKQNSEHLGCSREEVDKDTALIDHSGDSIKAMST